MFTGIIESLGRVESIESHEDSAIITISAGDLVADLGLGGSLAVNGVCLTSIRTDLAEGMDPSGDGSAGLPATSAKGLFRAEVMGETLRLTGIGALRPGDPINLERCTRASGRLDGHVVQGHVDGLGEVLSVIDHGEWSTVRVGIPNDLAPFTAVKGSIALNGVSLTLTAVSEPGASVGSGTAASEPAASGAWVEVGLIPATLAHTTFGTMTTGSPVNIEVDVLAKYTARILSFRDPLPPHSGTGASVPAPARVEQTNSFQGDTND